MGDWNWCDAVQAIGAVLTPILGLTVVNRWIGKRLSEKIDHEEMFNMDCVGESNVTKGNSAHDFWQFVQNEIPMLRGRSIPTRRFWSVPYKSGIRLVYVVLETTARVELYIDNGDDEWNLRTFNNWWERKNEIEKRLTGLSEQVVWFLRPNSRAKGIGLQYSLSGLNEPSGWKGIVDFYKKAAPLLENAVS